MRNATLFLAALASATLLGCSSSRLHLTGLFPIPFLAPKCVTANCALQVPVTEDSSSHTCSLELDNLNVSNGPTGERSMKWQLATPGYRFSKVDYKFGFFLKTDPDDDFKNVKISDDGQTITLKFEHNNPGAWYSYALTVQRSDQSFCLILDPWLIS